MGLVAPWHVDSSQTRYLTQVSCITRQILNHWTTREAPLVTFVQAHEALIPKGSWLQVCEPRTHATVPPPNPPSPQPTGTRGCFSGQKLCVLDTQKDL